MSIDNADLLKRVQKAMEHLEKINEGGESTRYADRALSVLESVEADLKLMVDDGR